MSNASTKKKQQPNKVEALQHIRIIQSQMQAELDTKLERANSRLVDFPVGVYDDRGIKDIVKAEVNSYLGRSIRDVSFEQTAYQSSKEHRPLLSDRLLQLEAKQKQQLESLR